jgi:hypothetical protein
MTDGIQCHVTTIYTIFHPSNHHHEYGHSLRCNTSTTRAVRDCLFEYPSLLRITKISFLFFDSAPVASETSLILRFFSRGTDGPGSSTTIIARCLHHCDKLTFSGQSQSACGFFSRKNFASTAQFSTVYRSSSPRLLGCLTRTGMVLSGSKPSSRHCFKTHSRRLFNEKYHGPLPSFSSGPTRTYSTFQFISCWHRNE